MAPLNDLGMAQGLSFSSPSEPQNFWQELPKGSFPVGLELATMRGWAAAAMLSP